MHSATKYLNGHSDMVGGIAVVGDDKELAEKMAFLQNSVGAVAGPFDSFLAMRGLKTLHLRMRAHCANALVLAQWLEKHPAVERVIYPGLKSHPQHALAKRQMDGFGGIISIVVKGGLRKARRVLERCKLFALAESLGGVESLIEHPAIMTHASVPPANRKRLGISDGLIRLSVGVEDVEDLTARARGRVALINADEQCTRRIRLRLAARGNLRHLRRIFFADWIICVAALLLFGLAEAIFFFGSGFRLASRFGRCGPGAARGRDIAERQPPSRRAGTTSMARSGCCRPSLRVAVRRCARGVATRVKARETS